ALCARSRSPPRSGPSSRTTRSTSPAGCRRLRRRGTRARAGRATYVAQRPGGSSPHSSRAARTPEEFGATYVKYSTGRPPCVVVPASVKVSPPITRDAHEIQPALTVHRRTDLGRPAHPSVRRGTGQRDTPRAEVQVLHPPGRLVPQRSGTGLHDRFKEGAGCCIRNSIRQASRGHTGRRALVARDVR